MRCILSSVWLSLNTVSRYIYDPIRPLFDSNEDHQAVRERERQRERQRDTERDRENGRERERESGRDRERQKE